MKTLEAIKCKDGWLVKVKYTIKVIDDSDVKTLINIEWLEINKGLSDKGIIYAEERK